MPGKGKAKSHKVDLKTPEGASLFRSALRAGMFERPHMGGKGKEHPHTRMGFKDKPPSSAK